MRPRYQGIFGTQGFILRLVRLVSEFGAFGGAGMVRTGLTVKEPGQREEAI